MRTQRYKISAQKRISRACGLTSILLTCPPNRPISSSGARSWPKETSAGALNKTTSDTSGQFAVPFLMRAALR